MVKKIMCSAALALAMVGTLTLPAVAAETIVIDDDAAVVSDRPAYSNRDTPVYHEGTPRVYGWTSERPLDCGAYHYWDGDRCLDARETPPDIGPKY